jgi:zinc-ribbon domain
MDFGSLLILIGVIVAVVAFLAQPLVENRASPATAADHRLSALQAEREAVLTMIREIEMDHAMGKIGADDFQAQRADLVVRGSVVLRELDALGGETASEDVDAAIEAAVAARRGRAPTKATGFCAHCGRALRDGDRFCASCGTPVSKEKGA